MLEEIYYYLREYFRIIYCSTVSFLKKNWAQEIIMLSNWRPPTQLSSRWIDFYYILYERYAIGEVALTS
jgi:hypothetical protein